MYMNALFLVFTDDHLENFQKSSVQHARHYSIATWILAQVKNLLRGEVFPIENNTHVSRDPTEGWQWQAWWNTA